MIYDIRLTREVVEDSALEITNGEKVRSVPELFFALKNMDKETFSHHVSKNHNDFADWIYENYGAGEIALKIHRILKKEKLEDYLEKLMKKDLKDFAKSRRVKENSNKINSPKSKRKVLEELKDVW